MAGQLQRPPPAAASCDAASGSAAGRTGRGMAVQQAAVGPQCQARAQASSIQCGDKHVHNLCQGKKMDEWDGQQYKLLYFQKPGIEGKHVHNLWRKADGTGGTVRDGHWRKGIREGSGTALHAPGRGAASYSIPANACTTPSSKHQTGRPASTRQINHTSRGAPPQRPWAPLTVLAGRGCCRACHDGAGCMAPAPTRST